MPDFSSFFRSPALAAMSSAAATVLEDAANAEAQRIREIGQRWEAYLGQHKNSLKVRPKEPNDNVRVNITGVIVDAGVDFLFGDDLDFEEEREQGDEQGSEDGADTPAEQWLNQVWDDSRRMTALQKLGINGGYAGHAALKIQPREGAPAEEPPRLIVIDPATFSAQWSEDDIDFVESYRITWNVVRDGKPAVRRQRHERTDAGQWEIIDEISIGDSGRWLLIGQTPWPYTWSPIIDCQNLPNPNEYYGRPDLTDDVVEANLAINGVLSDMRKSVRLHASPKLWGSGIGEDSKLDVAPDEMIILPDKEAQIGTIEARHDPAAIELYARLKAALHEQARVPEIASGKLDQIGQLSGLALQILYGPLVRKTRTKRRTYGELIRDTNRRLIELRFGEKAAAGKTLVHWPEMLPSDPKADAETALLDYEIGASKSTLLEKRGYDADTEQKKRTEEDAASQDKLGQGLLDAFARGGAPTDAPAAPGTPAPRTMGQPG